MKEIRNAIIESTSLGDKDHGGMSCWLYFNYGGSGQGFGGYCLDEPIKDVDGEFIERRGSAYGMEFIKNILEVLDVETWEELKGKTCRVEASDFKVHRIGHFLKDKWFDPEDLRKKFNL